MKPANGIAFRPETGAEAWIGLLAVRGIEYLFANGGTDFAPLAEAFAKGRACGWQMPKPVIVPHENLGVAMAHGFTMLTGRPQAMMVHVGVGTANAINGLINAARMQIPMLFTAGRTPLTESGAVFRRAQQLYPLGAGAFRPGGDAARVREMGLRAAPSRAGRRGARSRLGDLEERTAGAGISDDAAGGVSCGYQRTLFR
jgi:hypothetical protein